MRELHIYECEYCDTRFDSEEECYEHERKHKLEEIKNEYRAFDKKGKPIELNISNTEDVYFLEVSSDKAFEIIYDIFNEYGISGNPLENVTEVPLNVYWSYTEAEWVNFSERLQEMKKAAEVFEKVDML